MLALLLTLATLALTPAAIASDENILLFPTAGARDAADAGWDIPISGWVFELESRRLPLAILRKVVDPSDADDTPEARALMASRGRYVFADNERGEHVNLRLGSHSFSFGPTGKNGRFDGTLHLSDAQVAALPEAARLAPGVLQIDVALPAGDPRTFTGQLFLNPPGGLSIVSDIDDTIKITEVRDRGAMLRNTFVRPFREALGMAALYRTWAGRHDAVFHYLSGSPEQLWPALAEFMGAAGFPPGSAHLKRIRLFDRSLMQLFAGSEKHKKHNLEQLLARYPGRRFVLLGDSGEHDPEIYGDVARAHPGRISHIFIRDVSGADTSEDRYPQAFRDLPTVTSRVFTDPATLTELIGAPASPSAP